MLLRKLKPMVLLVIVVGNQSQTADFWNESIVHETICLYSYQTGIFIYEILLLVTGIYFFNLQMTPFFILRFRLRYVIGHMVYSDLDPCQQLTFLVICMMHLDWIVFRYVPSVSLLDPHPET